MIIVAPPTTQNFMAFQHYGRELLTRIVPELTKLSPGSHSFSFPKSEVPMQKVSMGRLCLLSSTCSSGCVLSALGTWPSSAFDALVHSRRGATWVWAFYGWLLVPGRMRNPACPSLSDHQPYWLRIPDAIFEPTRHPRILLKCFIKFYLLPDSSLAGSPLRESFHLCA